MSELRIPDDPGGLRLQVSQLRKEIMSHLLWFLGGIVIGVSLATYAWNKHFYSDVWNARKKILLEQLKSQEAQARRKTEMHELAISEMLDRRIAGKPAVDPTTSTRRRA
jgi:hypothetical protein